jgi:hypothetical protein
MNLTGNIYASSSIKTDGKIATNGLDPNNMPNGWAGGLRTIDGYASGTFAAGPDGKTINSYINSNGNIYASSSIKTDGNLTANNIKAGIAKTPSNAGSVEVKFSTQMSSIPVVCANVISTLNDTSMYSVSISNITVSGFSLTVLLKDGRNGENGGGYVYNKNINWIAIC